MNLDDHYIYVFVRQDITLAEQLIHAAHAAYHMGCEVGEIEGLPSLVVIGVPHSAALTKAIGKLWNAGIGMWIWCDPDTTYGSTAVATRPITSEQKQVLKNYRLWSHSPGAAKAACLVTEDGGANADVAQLREHPVSNREVATGATLLGANPAVGSNP